ncbi:MAG: M14 family zinc carboxypeptidase [Lysinibacillus sp.]
MKQWLLMTLLIVVSFGGAQIVVAEELPTTIDDAPVITEQLPAEIEQLPVDEVTPEPEPLPEENPIDKFENSKAIHIEVGTSLFSDRALTQEIANWQSAVTIGQFKVVNDVLELTVAGVKYYLDPQYVHVADEVKASATKTVGYVRFKEQLQIYTTSAAKDKLVTLTASQEQRIHIIGEKGNAFTVQVAGLTGYILKKDVYVNVKQSLKALKATSILEGKKKVATLAKNGVIKVDSIKGNTYTFHKKYTFTTDSIVETNVKMTWPKAMNQTYKVSLTAQKAAGLYDAKGIKVAEIPAKTKISLVNTTSKYGVVRMLGGTLYIDLKDFKHQNLIAGEKILTHHEMNYKLKLFAMMYPEFMELEEIGKSVEGRSILSLKVGTGKKQILMDASMHAREHMTTNVLMEMIDNYSYHYIHHSKFAGYNVRNVLNSVSIAFVPMINPDGVTLVQGGKVSTPIATLKKLKGGSTNFKRWKANIRGIDLNRNWDVRWHRLPVIAPKWELAKGPKPFSEPETIALRDFILKQPIKAYITYHSSGQIMFWEYGDGKGGKAKATALVRDLSRVTGYGIMKNSQTSATAASEPWVGKKKNAPAVTMEIAPYAGNGPVPLSRWASVWKKNQSVGLLVAHKAKNY